MYTYALRMRLYSALVEQLVSEEDVWKQLDGSVTVSQKWRIPSYPHLPRVCLPCWRKYHGEITDLSRATKEQVREILARRLDLQEVSEGAGYVQPLLF